jgi:hypothetical protein
MSPVDPRLHRVLELTRRALELVAVEDGELDALPGILAARGELLVALAASRGPTPREIASALRDGQRTLEAALAQRREQVAAVLHDSERARRARRGYAHLSAR